MHAHTQHTQLYTKQYTGTHTGTETDLLTYISSASTKRGSPETQCVLCAQPLSLRRDRPTSVVLYGNLSGPVPGTHYHKICSNKVCTLTQYYGYYTSGGETSQVFFNANWNYLPWFMSSFLTCFSMDFLRRVDSEVLIGQLSYKTFSTIFTLKLPSECLCEVMYHSTKYIVLGIWTGPPASFPFYSQRERTSTFMYV